MHSLSVLALAAAASALTLESRQQVSPAQCAKGVHVIAAGGGKSPDPSSIGRLGTLANLVVSKIPGSNFISLPYDKVEIMPQKLKPNAIPDGIVTFGQYVSQYHTACPNTKLVFLGYSSGAVITMQAMRTGVVSQSLAGTTVIANIAYGEQTFVPGQSYDRGTCKDGEGTQPTDNPASLGKYIPISQSYSDVNDPQSCSGPPQDYEVHLSYPGKYDNVAAQYVLQQYNSIGGGSMTNSSSSSASSMSATASSSASSSTGGIIGGGLGGSTGSSSASATTSGSSSASATMTTTAMTSSAASAASSAASAASSSAAAIGGGASSAMTSAASAVAGGASSVAAAGSSAATSLAAYNPANGQAILLPSLLNAACIGIMALLGAALI